MSSSIDWAIAPPLSDNTLIVLSGSSRGSSSVRLTPVNVSQTLLVDVMRWIRTSA